jgi:ferrous iron transport protein B
MSSGHDAAGPALANLPAATTSRNGTVRTVAVVGPPNSGKSTLFNRLTGLRQKVANYPGVTVEKRVGRARLSGRQEVSLVDLPGVYSLTPRSEDEKVTHDVLTGEMAGFPRPDAIVLLLDSTNLGRHLTLAAPILSLGLPTLIALNMADDLRARGGDLDLNGLADRVGAPVALISAKSGEGVEAVFEFLEGKLGVPKPVELPIISNIPQCRQWSANIGHATGYRAPAPPAWTRRLDGIFLHPIAGPLIFLAGSRR